jgi:RNA polymerase subunit RPABC4/transcription elongation factor Spt4
MNSLYKGNPSLNSYNMKMNQVVETQQQAVPICNSISFNTTWTAHRPVCNTDEFSTDR